MRKLALLLIACCLCIVQVWAQTKTVTGRVIDERGQPVPNVSVLVKGTQVGTTTGVNGSYTISIPAQATTLVFTALNFKSIEQTIGNRTTLNLTLQTSAGSNLDEVVVVGYQQRKKRDEAGAISSVSAKVIEDRPNLSLDKALQGAAAGVQVSANNGIPGGAISVRIRGIGSILAGNEPLYVVDGVQINIRNDASFSQSNPLAFLNPNDIESIDVLKDAASAAIYGSQASNGVVIVTTKKGKVGRTRIQFNGYAGTVLPIKKLDVLNSQQIFELRSAALARGNNVPLATAKRTALNEYRVPNVASLSDAGVDSAAAALATYDWQDAAIKNGQIQNYDLSISGGAERTTYRVSGSYVKQNTIISRADFNRGSLKFDLGQRISNRFNFTTSVNLSSSVQTLPFAVDGSFLGSPAFAASGILPVNPFYNADGTFYGIPIYNPANLTGTLNQNILAVNELNSGKQQTNQLVGNVALDVKLTDWLTFRTFYGLDYRNLQARRVTDPRTADGFARKGLTQSQSVNNTNFTTAQTLNFNHNFAGKHQVDGVVGYEFRQDLQYSLNASGDGFPSFQFSYLNNAANPVSVGEFTTQFKRNAFFGSVNYSFDSRYVLGVIARYDGSSRFGANERYGLFGGVKAAWNIDQEKFMENSNNVVNALRLRASYGTTGNDQIGNFDNLGLFGGGGVYNNSAGIAYTQLANPNLRWETNRTVNLGMDFGFFRNRINGSVEVYNKVNSGLLLNQPLQLTTGFASFASNIGVIRNRGVEVTLGVDVFRPTTPGGFAWTTNFTWSYNQNEVRELYGGLQFLPVTQGVTVPTNFPAQAYVQVGQPFGVLYTQQYAGVNPATGRAMWYDTLGNLTYQTAARDRRFGGNTLIPKFQGGFRNTFSYKRFTLEGFFQYEFGRVETDAQVNFLSENIGRINALDVVYEKSWRNPGEITSFPRFNSVVETKNSGAQAGDRLWFKADYIRLKTLILSYDFAPKLLSRLKATSARIYIQGTNLLTISDWYSYDVEFNRTTTGAAVGIIPQTRNITAGVQLGL